MPRGVRRLLAAAVVAAAVVVLAGCGVGPRPVVTVLPSDGVAAPTSAPVPSASVVPVAPTSAPSVAPAPAPAPPADGVDCGRGSVVLDEGSRSLILRGDCANVQVNGSGLQVDASAANIAVLVLSGSDITLTVGRAGQVSIRGNDIDVRAADVSMFDVEGDRNTLTATGGVEGVSFRGNDNAVSAARVGQVSDSGDRNVTG